MGQVNAFGIVNSASSRSRAVWHAAAEAALASLWIIQAAPAQMQDLIIHGGFDVPVPCGCTFRGWTTFGARLRCDYPHSPPCYALLGGGNNEDNFIYQDFLVPPGTKYIEVSFWWDVTTEEATEDYRDVMRATLRDTENQVLRDLGVISNRDGDKRTINYIEWRNDFRQYENQWLRIHFEAHTDEENVTNFRVDSVICRAWFVEGCDPPRIMRHPEDCATCQGEFCRLCVTAQALPAPDYYEWSRDGVPIPGSNAACYDATEPGEYRCTVYGCNASAVSQPARVTVKPAFVAPRQAAAEPPAACPGQPVRLSALGGSGESYAWYAGGCGGGAARVGAGPSVQISAPSSPTTYHVRMEGSCAATACASGELDVVPPPVPPAAAAADPDVARPGDPVRLSAVGGSGGSYVWYAAGCGSGQPIGSGPSIEITVPPAAATYYVRVEGDCGASACTAARLSIQSTDPPGPGGPDDDDGDGVPNDRDICPFTPDGDEVNEHGCPIECRADGDCDDGNLCTLGVCDGGACIFDAIDCGPDADCVAGECICRPPAAAANPGPADGATGVDNPLTLEWDAVGGGVTYDVYFGADPTLTDDDRAGRAVDPVWPLPSLDPGAVYYWRIDVVNDCAAAAGPVWSFSTAAPSWRLTVDTRPSSGAVVTHHADGEAVNLPIPAAPQAGLVFSGWSGDVPAGREFDDPLILLMDSDRLVLATFKTDESDAGRPAPSFCGWFGWIPMMGCLAALLGLKRLRAAAGVAPASRRWR